MRSKARPPFTPGAWSRLETPPVRRGTASRAIRKPPDEAGRRLQRALRSARKFSLQTPCEGLIFKLLAMHKARYANGLR